MSAGLEKVRRFGQRVRREETAWAEAWEWQAHTEMLVDNLEVQQEVNPEHAVAFAHTINSVCVRTGDFSVGFPKCKSQDCKSQKPRAERGDRRQLEFEVLHHVLAGTGDAVRVDERWLSEEGQRLLGIIRKHGAAAVTPELLEFEMQADREAAMHVIGVFNLAQAQKPQRSFDAVLALWQGETVVERTMERMEDVLAVLERRSGVDSIRAAVQGMLDGLPVEKRWEPEDAMAMAAEPAGTPDAVITELVDRGDKMQIVGASKIGKSFAVLQLALCLASGREWLGFKVPQKRKVLIVQLEINRTHYCRRLNRMMAAMGLERKEVGDRLHIFNGRARVPSEASLLQMVKAGGYEVVFVDPLYKLITGDENKAMDVKPVLAALDRICEETKATVFVVHHHPKGFAGERHALDRGAGSGVIGRDIDAHITLDRHEDGEHLVVETTQRNYPCVEPVTVRKEGVMLVLDNGVLPKVETAASRRSRLKPTLEMVVGVLGDKQWTLAEAEGLLRKNGWTYRDAKDAIATGCAQGRLVRESTGKSHKTMIRVVAGPVPPATASASVPSE